MKTITMIHPQTSETYEIPVTEMTDYMLQGLEPVEPDAAIDREQNVYVLCPDCQDSYAEGHSHKCSNIYAYDVDASDAVDRDIMSAGILTDLELTKENVAHALKDVKVLNAAIAYLGDLQTEDELASGTTNHINGQGFSAAFSRTGRRLWQWVTGKDAKTMEERWEKKCLSHRRADAAFQRQTRNYEFTSAVELAQHVCTFHWRQLDIILKPGFEGTELAKTDQSRSIKNPRKQDWVDITGARVLEVKGGGTQLLWDSRRIWLPTSQLKKVNGRLQVPQWLAQKNDMI